MVVRSGGGTANDDDSIGGIRSNIHSFIQTMDESLGAVRSADAKEEQIRIRLLI